MSKIEKTLIVFKPDALMRGIIGEVLSRFEKSGLKIVGLKMVAPDRDHYHHHYEVIGQLKSRKGDKVFEATLDSMLQGPVIAVVLEGVEAVEIVRKMVGSTEPKSSLPGTIRADYAHMSYGRADESGRAVQNVIHASGNSAEAEKEVAHWFSPKEIYGYKTVHEFFTHG